MQAVAQGGNVHTLGAELKSDMRKPQFVSAQFRQLPGGGTARPAGSTAGGALPPQPQTCLWVRNTEDSDRFEGTSQVKWSLQRRLGPALSQPDSE